MFNFYLKVYKRPFKNVLKYDELVFPYFGNYEKQTVAVACSIGLEFMILFI